MRIPGAGWLAVCAAACGGGGSSGTDGPPGGDAAAAECDRAAPFGSPTALVSLNTSDADEHPRLTPDELTIVFAIDRRALWIATRPSRTDAFGAAVEIQDAGGWSPWISPDGLRLYYADGGTTTTQIRLSTRASTSDAFPSGVDIGVAAAGFEQYPYLTADERELWFSSGASEVDTSIWHAPVATDGTVGTPVQVDLGTLNAWLPTISADGLELFFGAFFDSDYDIYLARRASTQDPFGAPAQVTELDDPAQRELPGWLSPDGCRLYYAHSPPGHVPDLYVASRPPR